MSERVLVFNGQILRPAPLWAQYRPKLTALYNTLRKHVALPHLSFDRVKLPSKLLERAKSASMTGLVMLAAIALVYASFFHIPYLNTNTTSNAVSAQQLTSVKPKIVSPPIVSSCNSTDSQTNALFTTCPSFAVNYAAQPNGSINTNQFNVYVGAPVSNHEDEYYTNNPANLRVQDGALLLEAQNTSDQDYDFTSARVNTQGKEDFMYGKIVVTAMLPSGIGTWPAIWMLPSQPKYASMSPASDPNRYLNDGEIDIAEAVGTQPGTVYGIAHSVAYPENGIDHDYFNTISIPNDASTYHTYELDWTPTSLTFKVDGSTYFTYVKQPNADWHSWPYNQPFYLVMNVALGGSWGGTDTAQFPGNGVDKSALPTSLKIQSIDYYSYVGQH